MIRGKELKQVHIGQAVIRVDGPGKFPKPGLGEMGVVTAIEETRWGIQAIVEWQGGLTDSAQSLKEDPNDKGIGVYLYPPKAA